MLSSVKRFSKLPGVLFIIGALITGPLAFAKTPSKPGNPGLPGCLADVEELTGQLTQCQEDLQSCLSQGNGQSFPAPVARTGQEASYGARDDGSLQKGVSLTTGERFTDNQNGTVTDNLTGLVWTKNANLFGVKTWSEALRSCNTLENGQFDLTDDSQLEQWRLPNIRELLTLVDYAQHNPALPSEPYFDFDEAVSESYLYWTSTTFAASPQDEPLAWTFSFRWGVAFPYFNEDCFVWCVRDAS